MRRSIRRSDVHDPADADEILPEYDFRHASRNKYASRYAEGSAVVVLEPDVAAAFPTSRAANKALRAIIEKDRSRRRTLRGRRPASRRRASALRKRVRRSADTAD